MDKFNNLIDKYLKLKTVFKSFFVVVMLFLVFFAINLFISLKNKPQSAYSVLSNNQENKNIMLQDTRIHNWNELEKK